MITTTKRSRLSSARLGVLAAGGQEIRTPCFLPDATRAVLKHVDSAELRALDMPAMVVNTLHLYLQPGADLIKRAGGAGAFMGFKSPLVSDSGGFQVYSLIHQGRLGGKITDEGAYFRSPLDGSRHLLTPEKSIQIQFDLGTEIMIALDDCPPHDLGQQEMEAAVERTIAWAGRCRAEFDRQIKKKRVPATLRPRLLGVVQGGNSRELREHCARELVRIGFDGLGYGARPVDADGNFMADIMEITAQAIPDDYFRFALGVGRPEDIVRSVRLGWDIFDCVIPSREGRHGRLFQLAGPKAPLAGAAFYRTCNINNARYRDDFQAINKQSKLPLLRAYSLAYLHHLFRVGEPLGQRLATLNNLEFYLDLMDRLRQEIAGGRY